MFAQAALTLRSTMRRGGSASTTSMATSRSIGRRHLAVMTLMAIGMMGCGGEHDGGAPTAKATVSRSAEQSARVLSQQQLEDAVVDAHDLPGVQVEEVGVGTKGVGNGVIHAVRPATDPSLCAPVGAAVDGASGYTPVGSVQRIAGTEGHSAIITLVSYRSADASRVMKELRAGLKSCKGYEAAGAGAMKVTYENVEAAKAPSRGDEGVAFRLKWVAEPGEDGLKVPSSVAVIRHGSTLAIYKAISDSPRAPANAPKQLQPKAAPPTSRRMRRGAHMQAMRIVSPAEKSP
ncbi:hypothetical protein OG698_01010 [Streptomyces sp. NBC_01003]|uniref:hypothetical protein n=1 Tax=Streptomyces sp. NBC_01003 TaxID=2903714 RepID=UPI003870249E|nr:hypothetical protein OG698_01010 [Streptomyces sp. NBC_01003]